MSSSSVAFRVQMSPNDLYRASIGVWVRKLWYFYPMFGCLALLALLALFSDANAQRKQQFRDDLIPLGYYFAGFYALFVFILPYFSPRSNFKSHKNLHGVIHYTFSKAAIEIETQTSSSRTDWTNVYKAIETKSFFFIYLSKQLRWVIPKRAIPDAAALDSLRQLLRTCVAGKVKLIG